MLSRVVIKAWKSYEWTYRHQKFCFVHWMSLIIDSSSDKSRFDGQNYLRPKAKDSRVTCLFGVHADKNGLKLKKKVYPWRYSYNEFVFNQSKRHDAAFPYL